MINERESFEALPEIKQFIDKLIYGEKSEVYIAKERNEADDAIATWVNGAWFGYKAKAQAVQEGYVLVNSESLLFHAQSIRMFNDGDWENHYEEIEEHVCAIEEIVKPNESGAEG